MILTLVAVFAFLSGQAQQRTVEVVDQGLGALQTPEGLIQAPVFDLPLVADERSAGWPVLSMVVKGAEGRILNATYQPYPADGLQNLMAYLSKHDITAPTAWPMTPRGV